MASVRRRLNIEAIHSPVTFGLISLPLTSRWPTFAKTIRTPTKNSSRCVSASFSAELPTAITTSGFRDPELLGMSPEGKSIKKPDDEEEISRSETPQPTSFNRPATKAAVGNFLVISISSEDFSKSEPSSFNNFTHLPSHNQERARAYLCWSRSLSRTTDKQSTVS